MLGISDGIDQMGTVKWDLALCLLLAWIVVYACICKGIRSSGKVSSPPVEQARPQVKGENSYCAKQRKRRVSSASAIHPGSGDSACQDVTKNIPRE